MDKLYDTISTGNVFKVKEGCSRLAEGTEVVILGYVNSSNEFYCRAKDGQTCTFIKADLLDIKGD